MWWAVQTLTSLGYGDFSPQTILGKVLLYIVLWRVCILNFGIFGTCFLGIGNGDWGVNDFPELSRWLALKSHYDKALQKTRVTILIAGGWILLRRVRCACDGSSHPHCCGQLCQLLQQAGVSTRVMMMLRQILSPYWKQNNRWLNTRNDLKLISRRGKLRSRERPPQGGFIFLLYCLYHSITL